MADRGRRRARQEPTREHRADHLDTARDLEPVSHLELLREWQISCPIFMEALDEAGVGLFRHLSYVPIDSGLITALVERWSPTTNTFILPVGEMTVTLEDVSLIFGVRIDGPPLIGPPVIGPGARWISWPACCDELLGLHPREGFLYRNPRNMGEGSTFKMGQASASTCLPLRWLRWMFYRDSYDGLYPVELAQHVRGYILYSIGCFLMPDTSGSEVHLQWLPLMEDLATFEQYSLGGAVLAHLYRELAESVRPDKARIAGCLHLLQVWAWEHFHVGRPTLTVPRWGQAQGMPLGFRWSEDWARYQPVNTVEYYRNELDALQQSQVIWEPYRVVNLQNLPPICIDGDDLRLARVPLISWVKVEWYFPDRVMRQFGHQQHTELESSTMPQGFKRVDARGKGGVNWLWYHRAECELWGQRYDRIQEPVIVDPNPKRALYIYLQWYKTWARMYLVQPPQEPPTTYYPRAPVERGLYDLMIETNQRLVRQDDPGTLEQWGTFKREVIELQENLAQRLHLGDLPSTSDWQQHADATYTPHTDDWEDQTGPTQTQEQCTYTWEGYGGSVGPSQTQVGEESTWPSWGGLPSGMDYHIVQEESTPAQPSQVDVSAEDDQVDITEEAEPRRLRRAPVRYTPGSGIVYRRKR